MDAQTLNIVNILTTRRNLAVRKLAQLAGAGQAEAARQLRTFIVGADARVKALGAHLIAIPGRPGAVIADVFLPIVSD